MLDSGGMVAAPREESRGEGEDEALHFRVAGRGIKEATVREPCRFHIIATDADGTELKSSGLPFQVAICGVSRTRARRVAPELDDEVDCFCVEWQPQQSGRYLIFVSLHSKPLPGSPFAVPELAAFLGDPSRRQSEVLVCAPFWPSSNWFREIHNLADAKVRYRACKLQKLPGVDDAPNRLHSWPIMIFHLPEVEDVPPPGDGVDIGDRGGAPPLRATRPLSAVGARDVSTVAAAAAGDTHAGAVPQIQLPDTQRV